jgi:hypothetical protein
VAARASFASLLVMEKMIAEGAGKSAPQGVTCVGVTIDETPKAIRLRATAYCAREGTALAMENFFTKGIKFYAARFAEPRAGESKAGRAGRELLAAALADAKAQSGGRLIFVNADIDTEKALDCLARITPEKKSR